MTHWTQTVNVIRQEGPRPDKLKKSLDEFPDHFLKIVGGRVFCEVCNRIPIRSCLTPTTYIYRYSHSLTNHHSSSRVSRSEGEGEEWVRGFGRLLAVWNYPLSYTCGRPSRKWHMVNKDLCFAVNDRLLIAWSKNQKSWNTSRFFYSKWNHTNGHVLYLNAWMDCRPCLVCVHIKSLSFCWMLDRIHQNVSSYVHRETEFLERDLCTHWISVCRRDTMRN